MLFLFVVAVVVVVSYFYSVVFWYPLRGLYNVRFSLRWRDFFFTKSNLILIGIQRWLYSSEHAFDFLSTLFIDFPPHINQTTISLKNWWSVPHKLRLRLVLFSTARVSVGLWLGLISVLFFEEVKTQICTLLDHPVTGSIVLWELWNIEHWNNANAIFFHWKQDFSSPVLHDFKLSGEWIPILAELHLQKFLERTDITILSLMS